MKILHITRNIPIKNLSGNDVILDLIKELEHKNIKQNIIFPAEFIPKIPFLKGRAKIFSELKGQLTVRDIDLLFLNFIRLPGQFAFYISNFYLKNKNLANFINETDCIHAHYILPDGLIANKLAKTKNIPYVITVRQGDIDRLKRLNGNGFVIKLYREVLSGASQVIAVNYAIRDFLLKELNYKSDVLPHAINRSLIEYKERSINGSIEIITSAQFIQRKNIEWVINSFKAIRKIYDYDCNLTIVGDGPLKYHLKEIAGGDKRIKFTGWISKNELFDKFLVSDIFVMPSDNETFGMAYIEAAAKNCLIIGKRGTGIDGHFEDGKNAFFINDELELTSILANLISDQKKLENISNAGTDLVAKEMTWDYITEKYISIYQRACRNE